MYRFKVRCVFVSKTNVYLQYGTETKKLKPNYSFWREKMEPRLLEFYNNCLLPELIDPRHTRNLPIRDLDYVIIKEKHPPEDHKRNEKENYPIPHQDIPNEKSTRPDDYEKVISFCNF